MSCVFHLFHSLPPLNLLIFLFGILPLFLSARPLTPTRRIWSIRCRADSQTTANNTKQCKRSYGQYISRYRRTKAIPSGSYPTQPARQWPLVVDLILLGLKDFGIGEVSSINAYTRGILLTGGWVMVLLLLF